MATRAPGDRFADRYELMRQLGRGGMGEIWRALDTHTGDEVAIKLLQPALSRDPELVERFEREFAASSRIASPNAVRVVGGGRAPDGQLHMVMELLGGRPLSAIAAAEAPLDPLRVADLGRQIARGLAAAHAVGVIHRDLKPENVMVRRDQGRDVATVFDFGLSLQEQASAPRLTALGLRLGTPATMAPEYIFEGLVDHRSDLYALGVVLYELACGSLPFDGSAYEIMNAHVNEEPPPLAERCAAPGWLCEAIHRLLQKDPEDRPRDGAEAERSLTPPG